MTVELSIATMNETVNHLRIETIYYNMHVIVKIKEICILDGQKRLSFGGPISKKVVAHPSDQ